MAYLQNQVQLEYWLNQLRWDKTVGNGFRETFKQVQLKSGFTTTPLEEMTQVIKYIYRSYMLNFGNIMGKMVETELCIEGAWAPKL